MQDTITYKDSGVDIEEGYRLVKNIKPMIASTHRKGVLSELGGFGGLFEIDTAKYPKPVLVSGTDGVGTKLKLAFELSRHDTVGIDLVAMCVNDILTSGAEPLFFLDYIATGYLNAEQTSQVVQGVSQGCLMAKAALIGGETAEMPGFYQPGEYDLAGFAVGCVNKDKIITGKTIAPGDVIVGLASSGLHSNGFSLVRRLLSKEHVDIHKDTLNGTPWSDLLLEPTRIYVKNVLEILESFNVKGMAHITGGGLIENIPRMFQDSLCAELNLSWPIPDIFTWIKEKANLSERDWLNTFNCGIGYVLVVSQQEKEALITQLNELGEQAFDIGKIATKKTESIVFSAK